MLLFLLTAGLTVASAFDNSIAALAPTVGINNIDLLWNQLGQGPRGVPQVTESMKDSCLVRNLTLTRFAATPYWPNQVKSTYIANRTLYWANVADLVSTAKKMHCKLIPSLFFNWFAFADVAGEPLGDSMRNTSSKTRSMWLDYISEFVSLFRSEPTIVAWELGNELNLIADLNLTEQQPSIAPSMGTPEKRTQRDNFSTTDMIDLTEWMASSIRSYDTELQRPIGGGFATPRRSAAHLRESYLLPHRDWTADSEPQFEQNIADIHEGLDVVTVHYYPGSGDRFGVQDPNSTQTLTIAALQAQRLGKSFYVGEFGNENPGPRVFSHAVLSCMQQLKTLHHMTVPVYGTIWVWEFYQFSATVAAPFSIVPGRDDAIIAALENFNANVREGERENE